jgi:hypothetical protein
MDFTQGTLWTFHKSTNEINPVSIGRKEKENQFFVVSSHRCLLPPEYISSFLEAQAKKLLPYVLKTIVQQSHNEL